MWRLLFLRGSMVQEKGARQQKGSDPSLTWTQKFSKHKTSARSTYMRQTGRRPTSTLSIFSNLSSPPSCRIVSFRKLTIPRFDVKAATHYVLVPIPNMTLRTRTENWWEAGRKMGMLAKKARRKYTMLILRSSKRTCSLRSFRTGEPAYLYGQIYCISVIEML